MEGDGQRTLFNMRVGEGNPILRPEDTHPLTLQTTEQMFGRLAPEVSDAEALQILRLV